jgi:iron(III) transport system substrate-binding protein
MLLRGFLCTILFISTAALAQADGKVVLYTSLAPTESGPLAAAFEKKTGAKVEIWRALSEKVVQRVISEARAGRASVDVVETNAPEMEMMAREKVFAPVVSPHLADLPAASVPPHRLWVPDRLNFFVVAYNTSKVRRQDLPASYRGFLDPKWQGRIGIEATDAEWMATLLKVWGTDDGMAFFRKLAAMKPDMRKGHILLAQLVASGEVPVGLTAYQSNADSLKRKGAPIDWAPIEPVVARAQGIAIAKDAPHADAARAFVDFVLSPEGQELLDSMGRTPVSTRARTSIPRFAYKLVDPVTMLDEQARWEKLWQELFLQ